MPLTREEYVRLLERSEAGEITLFLDPTQCKDVLLKIRHVQFKAETGTSLRAYCNTIKAITYVLDPFFMITAMVGACWWLKWWGCVLVPAIIALSCLLKSSSSGGRQRLLRPLLLFAMGLEIAVLFRNQGPGFIVFMLGLSFMYLAEKMLYALPVLFFSFLIPRSYELASMVYEDFADDFNRQLGCPVMWYAETVDGKVPEPPVKMPSRLYLTLYGLLNKQCRRDVLQSLREDKDFSVD